MKEKEGTINLIALKEDWRRWNSNTSTGMSPEYKERQLFPLWKRMGADTGRFICMLRSFNKVYHVPHTAQTAGDTEIKITLPIKDLSVK